MTKFLLIFFTVIGSVVSSARAAVIPPLNSLTAGGAQMVNVSGSTATSRVLYAIGDNTHTFATPRQGAVTSGYQVPGGKTFTILSFLGIADGTTAFDFGYADTDVGQDSAAGPTNQLYQHGSSSPLSFFLVTGSAFSGAPVQIPMRIVVPASKYVVVSGIGGANWRALVFGVEQ